MKVLVLDGPSYYWPHEEFGPATIHLQDLVKHPKNISLVVFTGGADIDPALYNHPKNSKTSCSKSRDERDLLAFKLARRYDIPCAGICRGGQFLTAMSGGYLYQHVNGHSMCNHHIKTSDGDIINVSGDHHQMFGCQLRYDDELLAWAEPKRSNVYEYGSGSVKQIKFEPEVVYYRSINSLAVQYHPEWMDKGSNGVLYYKRLLQRLKCEQL